MFALEGFLDLAVNDSSSTRAVSTGSSNNASPPTRAIYTGSSSSMATVSPDHADILEMHANSRSNAIIYIGVVLFLYVIGMVIVIIKYVRTERYEARLTRLFQNLVQRERFFRVSRHRRSSAGKTTQEPSTCPGDDIAQSSSFVVQENGLIDIESKL